MQVGFFGQRRALVAVLASVWLMSGPGCGATLSSFGANDGKQAIHQLELPIANVFIVAGTGGTVVVDTGDPGDHTKVINALRRLGLEKSVRLIVVTHAHADHIGSAKDLSDALGGVPIALGAADRPTAVSGRNPEQMHPVSIVAQLIELTITHRFRGFEPDMPVASCLDLRPYGVVGTVYQTGGHTPGSVVVVAGTDAIVGDALSGGYLGGKVGPAFPTEHYFQGKPEEVAAILDWVLDQGAERIFVGHGGPIGRDDLVELKATGKFDANSKLFSASCPA